MTAAALLARDGWSVCVLEREARLGGAIHTVADYTLPGFTHEVLSSWHPLFTGSAAYGELGEELGRRGLEYLNTELPTATAFPDGSAMVLHTSLEANVAEFDRFAAGDGAAWQRQFDEFMANADLSFGVLGTELWSGAGLGLGQRTLRRLGRRGLLEFAGHALSTCRDWTTATFRSPEAHGLLAPWVLHTGLGPESAVSGFMTQVIACALQLGGMPVPVGGGVKLVDALAGIVRDAGGELRTERRRRADPRHRRRRDGRRAGGRRDGRGRARRHRGRHADAALRPAPRRRRRPARGDGGRAPLSLRPRGHADPPRARRAAALARRRRRAPRRRRRSSTSRRGSTACRAP